MAVKIPEFNSDGLLPHKFEDVDAWGQVHIAKPAEVVIRFGTTKRRRELLLKWLEYRERLRKLPLKNGFQVIAGSFVEEKNEPSDIDLLTIYERDEGWSVSEHNIDPVLDPKVLKLQYDCDFIPIDLTDERKQEMFYAITFFWSLFSRRKSDRKDKGLVQVALNHRDDKDDQRARAALKGMGDDNE